VNTLDFIAGYLDLDLAAPSPIVARGTSRALLARLLADGGFNVGVEVGTAEGYHAEMLLAANPRLMLWCVDCYQQYPGYEEYADPDQCERDAMARLAPYYPAFIREFSVDAAAQFDDNSLDFVYLDAAHDAASVAADLAAWTPKVRAGGIVFGHDYKHTHARLVRGKARHAIEVKPAVDAFCASRHPWLVLANDVGRDNPGWLFVK
jgi:hypothetical protein